MPQCTEMSTIVNEVSGTTSMKTWKFEIFHSEFVDGIRQYKYIDGAVPLVSCIGKVQLELFKLSKLIQHRLFTFEYYQMSTKMQSFILPYFHTIYYIRHVTSFLHSGTSHGNGVISEKASI